MGRSRTAGFGGGALGALGAGAALGGFGASATTGVVLGTRSLPLRALHALAATTKSTTDDRDRKTTTW